MKLRDHPPFEIPLGIKTPVGGDEDHGPKRGEVDRHLEQERNVLLHSVKIPTMTEGVEGFVKSFILVLPAERKAMPKIAFEPCAGG